MAKKADKISEQDLKDCLLAIMDALADDDYNYYSDFDISTADLGNSKVKVKAKMIVTVPKGTRPSVAEIIVEKLVGSYAAFIAREGKDVNVYLSRYEEDQSRVLIKLKEESVHKGFDKPSGENKGSGGGSTNTRIVESAQCLYCSLAFNVYKNEIDKDQLIVKSDLDKALSKIKVDSSLDEMLSIASAWKKSSILGANKLYNELEGGSYEFHRGVGIDKEINTAYKAIKNDGVKNDALNIQQKVPQSEDKWNPADIWIVEPSYATTRLKKAYSQGLVKNLNDFLIEEFDHKKLIGVSLKKITGAANIVAMNKTEDRFIDGAGFGGANFNYDTVDTYIQFKSGTKSIQFRNFDSSGASWQGEVGQKGSGAKHGKIGGGAIWAVLDAHDVNYSHRVTNNKGLYDDCSDDNKKMDIAKEIYNLLKKIPASDRIKMGTEEQEISDIINREKSHRWMYTKFLGLTLIDVIKNHTDRDEIVKDIYLYASSQHSMSGVYYKLT